MFIFIYKHQLHTLAMCVAMVIRSKAGSISLFCMTYCRKLMGANSYANISCDPYDTLHNLNTFSCSTPANFCNFYKVKNAQQTS